jgi:hypothetical protein
MTKFESGRLLLECIKPGKLNSEMYHKVSHQKMYNLDAVNVHILSLLSLKYEIFHILRIFDENTKPFMICN